MPVLRASSSHSCLLTLTRKHLHTLFGMVCIGCLRMVLLQLHVTVSLHWLMGLPSRVKLSCENSLPFLHGDTCCGWHQQQHACSWTAVRSTECSVVMMQQFDVCLSWLSCYKSKVTSMSDVHVISSSGRYISSICRRAT